MPKPIKSHVERILAKNDRVTKIWRAIHHGWDSRNDHPRAGAWRRKTTRASVVWEDTIDKAIELLEDDLGVVVIHHYDTYSFIVDGIVLLRFKKADATLKTSNVFTPLSDLFDDHDHDLFGYHGLQRVEAVYMLNQLGTAIIWTGIAASDLGKFLWKLELDGPSAVEPVRLPTSKPGPQVGDSADLARIKKDKSASDPSRKRDEDGE